jgi:hypothetical protein
MHLQTRTNCCLYNSGRFYWKCRKCKLQKRNPTVEWQYCNTLLELISRHGSWTGGRHNLKKLARSFTHSRRLIIQTNLDDCCADDCEASTTFVFFWIIDKARATLLMTTSYSSTVLRSYSSFLSHHRHSLLLCHSFTLQLYKIVTTSKH